MPISSLHRYSTLGFLGKKRSEANNDDHILHEYATPPPAWRNRREPREAGRAVGLAGMPNDWQVRVEIQQQGELRTSPARGHPDGRSGVPPARPSLTHPTAASRLPTPVLAGSAPGILAPHSGRTQRPARGGPGAPQAQGSGSRPGRRGRRPRTTRGGVGSPDPWGPGRGGGGGKATKSLLTRRRRARSRPSRFRRPAGSWAGCAARGARPPPPLPHRPLAHGEGGRKAAPARPSPPRAPPPPGLLAAIPTLLPRLQLPVAHGLGGGRGGARAQERRPDARPRRAHPEGGRRSSPGEEEVKEEEVGAATAAGPTVAPRPLRPLPSFSFARSSPACPAPRLCARRW